MGVRDAVGRRRVGVRVRVDVEGKRVEDGTREGVSVAVAVGEGGGDGVLVAVSVGAGVGVAIGV